MIASFLFWISLAVQGPFSSSASSDDLRGIPGVYQDGSETFQGVSESLVYVPGYQGVSKAFQGFSEDFRSVPGNFMCIPGGL